MKAYDLVLLFLEKKVFGFRCGLWGPTGFQLKLLILIECCNIFHWKPEKNNRVGVVLWQHFGQIRPNVVKKVKKRALSKAFCIVVKIFEEKFKANIARNARFEGCLRLKKLIIFKKFTLAHLKVIKLINIISVFLD